MVENVIILEEGIWTPENLKIHKIAEMSEIKMYPGDNEAIEKKWKDILTKSPKAFPGDTICFAGSHQIGRDLIAEVIISDYKVSQIVGWLGAAMIPITTDYFIGLQCQVASVAATVGKGIRVPGCTPENTEVIDHIIKEMKEEFNVEITRNNLTIIGLLKVKPPIASLHNAFVVVVKVPFNREELRRKWETAEDRKEGELVFLELDYKQKKLSWGKFWEEVEAVKGEKLINVQSLTILEMIAKSEFGTKEGEGELYEKFKKLTAPYHDARDDDGHAEVVEDFSVKLIPYHPGVNSLVIRLTALSHDDGWCQLLKEERFLIFDPNRTKEQELEVRVKHEKSGAELTRRNLEILGCDPSIIEQVVAIIDGHDTREHTISQEDAIVKDADKLWRYSEIGFRADLKRMKDVSPRQLWDKLEKNIEKQGFFFTESARKIARDELNKRSEEF
ncbi:MAG: hypothetical protein NTU58_00680 [Candidatus Nealsonbacteria bacterium]|nr:hypothetical protein [Candidatus Nealsonbacteria bacterium]